MSIKRSFNFLPQQRVDLAHLKQIESGVANDFDTLAQALIADKSYVVTGLTLTNLDVSLPTNLKVVAGGSVIWHKQGSEAGTFYTIESGDGEQQLSPQNDKVTGVFSTGVNYIGLDFEKSPDTSTSDYMKFISRETDTEYTEVVPLGRVLQYQFVISSQPFARQSTVCPIAKVTVDTDGQITNITDCRDMLFRLGVGGDAPNSLSYYSWGDREEKNNVYQKTPLINPFVGTEDKEISSLKEWMDAIATSIWELRGGEAWFSPVSRDNVKLAYSGDPAGTNLQPNGDNFMYADGGDDLNWSKSASTVATVVWADHKLTAGSKISVSNSSNTSELLDTDYTVISVTPNVSFTIDTAVSGSASGTLKLSKTICWSGLMLLFENSTAWYNTITNGSQILDDGWCLYVDADRAANSTINPQAASLLSLNTSALPGKRIILAWRKGDEVFTRDRAYEAGRNFVVPPAEIEELGSVRLSRNLSGTDFSTPSVDLGPVVISVHGGTILATGTNKYGLQATGIGTGSGLRGIGGANGIGVEATGTGTGIGLKAIGGGTWVSGDDAAGIVASATVADTIRASASGNGRAVINLNKTGTGGYGAYIRATATGSTGIDVEATSYGIKSSAPDIAGWFIATGSLGIRTEANGTGILSMAGSLGTGGELYGGDRNPGTAFDSTGLEWTYTEPSPGVAPDWEKNGLVSVAGLGNVHGTISAGSGTGAGIESWGGASGGAGGIFTGGTGGEGLISEGKGQGVGLRSTGGTSYVSGDDGVGIVALATVNDGIQSLTSDTGKSGIKAESSGASGYGGYFVASGTNGTGVYASGPKIGVEGQGAGNTSAMGVKGTGASASSAWYSGDGMWGIGGIGTLSSLGGGHGIQASGGVGPSDTGGSGGVFYGAGRKPGMDGYTNSQTQSSTDGPWIGTGLVAIAGTGDKRGIVAYGSGGFGQNGAGIHAFGGDFSAVGDRAGDGGYFTGGSNSGDGPDGFGVYAEGGGYAGTGLYATGSTGGGIANGVEAVGRAGGHGIKGYGGSSGDSIQAGNGGNFVGGQNTYTSGGAPGRGVYAVGGQATGGDTAGAMGVEAIGGQGNGTGQGGAGIVGRGGQNGGSGIAGSGLVGYPYGSTFYDPGRTGVFGFNSLNGTNPFTLESDPVGVYGKTTGDYSAAVAGQTSGTNSYGGYFNANQGSSEAIFAEASGAGGKAGHFVSTGTNSQAGHFEVTNTGSTAIYAVASGGGYVALLEHSASTGTALAVDCTAVGGSALPGYFRPKSTNQRAIKCVGYIDLSGASNTESKVSDKYLSPQGVLRASCCFATSSGTPNVVSTYGQFNINSISVDANNIVTLTLENDVTNYCFVNVSTCGAGSPPSILFNVQWRQLGLPTTVSSRTQLKFALQTIDSGNHQANPVGQDYRAYVTVFHTGYN